MEAPVKASSGWEYVAESDAMASVIDVARTLPETESFTQSELAGRADVPLKQLYLEETIQTLETLGVFETADDDNEETRYVVNTDSELLTAAERFDQAFTGNLD